MLSLENDSRMDRERLENDSVKLRKIGTILNIRRDGQDRTGQRRNFY